MHYCHSGVNEVVMLNWLSNDNKEEAMKDLLGSYFNRVDLCDEAKEFLHSSPHDVFAVSASLQKISTVSFYTCTSHSIF